MVTLTINGQTYQADEQATVLQVAQKHGVDIPTLCYHPAVAPYASCRLCVVEATLRGRTRIVVSCAYPVAEGLAVETDTPRLHRIRRTLLELYLAQAPGAQRVRELAAQYGVTETRFAVRDPKEKCILCGLCERVCAELIGRSGISFAYRGVERKVTPPFEEPLKNCLGCGACVFVCPTGAVVEKLGAEVLEIEPWGARVPLATCRVCGEPVGPAAALEEIAEKLQVDTERLLLCARCRRQQHGGELARSSRRDREKLAGRASPAPTLE